MTVSKQNYTVSAPWLNFQLADLFRQAFIDANLMSGWFDEWTTGSGENTVHHKVLRIIYDSTKTYGTVYHWLTFLVDGSTAYSYAHQWDVVNHRPIGTARRDYLGNQSFTLCTASNTSTCSSRTFGTNVLSTTTTLTRYTSGEQSNFSMFMLKGGTNFFSFFFIPPNSQPQAFADLDRNTCGGLMLLSVGNNSTTTGYVSNYISFEHMFILRNSIFSYSRFGVRDAHYARAIQRGVSYTGQGQGSGTGGWDNTDSLTGLVYNNTSRLNNNDSWNQQLFSIVLPVETASFNPQRTSDIAPVFTDLPFSMYFLNRLPTDFGIAFHFPDSTMEVQDRFRVTPGVEEWEILARSNYTHPNNPSALVLARVI